MFFQGNLPASVTLATAFSDLVGLLTGSITTVGGLGLAWTSTTLVTDTAAGWTNYDAAAGSAANGVTPCVLRAAWSDDGAKYKNVYINSPAAGVLGFEGYDTWNSATHTGTNRCVTGGVTTVNIPGAVSMTALNTITMSASSKHIYIELSNGQVANTLAHFILSEFSRDDPWNTVANGYPAWLTYGFANNVNTQCQTYLCRWLNPTTGVPQTSLAINSGATGSVPGFAWSPSIGCQVSGLPSLSANGGIISLALLNNTSTAPGASTQGLDTTLTGAKYIFGLCMRVGLPASCATGPQSLFGDLSAATGMLYCCSYTVGNTNDEVTVGAVTYHLRGNTGNNSKIALKKS